MTSSRFKCAASIGVIIVLIIALILGLVVGLGVFDNSPRARTFAVNYDRNSFVMDGKNFKYVSGSFHYFRALPHVWQQRLHTMRLAGLNVIDTYVEWSLHNPYPNFYDFDGIADLEQFLRIAQAEGLYVILRPGPYICAERDNGGLPYWLLTKYPGIKVRTSDENFLKEVRKWYNILMPKIQKHLYENGGPIIMIQIENEYGVSKLCDRNYLIWLRDETEKYVEGKAVLFTTDIPNSVEEMSCGKIENVLATTDFGIDKENEMDAIWDMLRKVQPNGPLVNSEFYPGWLTHWQEKNQRRDAEDVSRVLRKMLNKGVFVNIYMFFGGTNFGFTAGANDWGHGKYMADITSYDYDAVMDECGDPASMKYVKVRDVIGKYIDLPAIPMPCKAPKMILPDIQLNPIGTLLSELGRKYLTKRHYGDNSQAIALAEKPQTFEELHQYSGLVLYETDLPDLEIDPSLLKVENLHDRALIFVDEFYVGTLSRENAINSLPINAGLGTKLQILVENQGRINFNIFNDFKGILGAVTIQKFDGLTTELNQWTMTGYPLTKFSDIEDFISNANEVVSISKNGILYEGPTVFSANFDIDIDPILDTYLDVTGWGKGVAYVNGMNIGRYWPLVGPQITLYIPGDLLKQQGNNIVLIEYQRVHIDKIVKFTDKSRLDGKSSSIQTID